MHLKRVRVPDFRVLKDVDITFEKEFTPRIFPLGSQNGGGKSTLLQLIFVLLHCSQYPEKLHFVKNMIDGFKLRDGENTRMVATFDIVDGEEESNVDFFVCGESYLKTMFGSEEIEENIISNFILLQNNKSKISQDEKEIYRIENSPLNLAEQQQRNNKIQLLRTRIANMNKTNIELSVISKIFLEKIESNNILCVTTYSSESNDEEQEVLLCQVKDLDLENTKKLLNRLSNKVFLAAPSTQVFLFLSRKAKMSLLQNSEYANDNYYSYLTRAKSELPELFTYNFFPVDLLIDSFKAAGDKDFKVAIKTGAYGNHYQTLLNEFNSLLTNKKLNLKVDLSGVNFSMDNGNEIVELGPEDLSHGELKRLSIYMWLKYRNIEDAIVLMDEIEIAFHPDWQYRIIADLQDWGPNNQYILATHSYSLCEALTPAHVKEIEPKLLPVKANN